MYIILVIWLALSGISKLHPRKICISIFFSSVRVGFLHPKYIKNKFLLPPFFAESSTLFFCSESMILFPGTTFCYVFLDTFSMTLYLIHYPCASWYNWFILEVWKLFGFGRRNVDMEMVLAWLKPLFLEFVSPFYF